MVKFNIKVVILILLFLNLSNFIVENATEITQNIKGFVNPSSVAESDQVLASNMARPSTGKRKNSTADDAAGAAIIKKLTAVADTADTAADTAADTVADTAAAATSLMSHIQNANHAVESAALARAKILEGASASVQNSSTNFQTVNGSELLDLTASDSHDTNRSRAGDTEAPGVINITWNGGSWIKLENISIGNPNNFKVSFNYQFTNNVNWNGRKLWKTFIACTKTIDGIQSDHFMIRGHGFSKNFGVWSGKGSQYTRTSKHPYTDGKLKLIDFNSGVHKFTFTYTKGKGCEIFVDDIEWKQDIGITTYKNWGNEGKIFDDDNATYTWYVGGDYDKRYPSGKNHPIGVKISNIIITSLD